jgi:maltose alpha-D-glucosyltransferase/alpha-amylase
MLRSFHYAAQLTLTEATQGSPLRAEDVARLQPWAERWVQVVSRAFLRAYFETAGHADWLPPEQETRRRLLEVLQLEKALYELSYELNNRPHLVGIPLRGVLDLLEAERRP